LVLSLLCAVTVMTLDAAGGEDSPVQPLRTGAVAVFGPLQTGAATAFDPVVGAVETIGELRQLRDENAALQERNDELAAELATTELDRNRLAEYDALSEASAIGGFDLVPARVVAVGPAQAFARTVTIDAGAADGVRDDLTVVAAPGLVGRVLSVGQHTATVLLAVDAGSVIGGRLDRSMELGFLRGNGSLGSDGALSLDLVDPDAVPAAGDTVVTWGSRGGAPYVAGVPVGEVVQVRTSAGEQSVTASVRPFVDMSAIDLVGVVVGPADSAERSFDRSLP
jgi:rod shape-determining protein MreC